MTMLSLLCMIKWSLVVLFPTTLCVLLSVSAQQLIFTYVENSSSLLQPLSLLKATSYILLLFFVCIFIETLCDCMNKFIKLCISSHVFMFLFIFTQSCNPVFSFYILHSRMYSKYFFYDLSWKKINFWLDDEFY